MRIEGDRQIINGVRLSGPAGSTIEAESTGRWRIAWQGDVAKDVRAIDHDGGDPVVRYGNRDRHEGGVGRPGRTLLSDHVEAMVDNLHTGGIRRARYTAGVSDRSGSARNRARHESV